MLWGLDTSVLIIILSFALGSFFDGIFLNRHKDNKGAHLTYLGLAYFWIIFLIFNSILNLFILIYNSISKNKQKWLNIFKVSRYLVSFWYAVVFIFIEILTAGLISHLLVQTYISNFTNLENIITNLLLVSLCLSTFSYFFFQIVPFSKKRKPFIMGSIIISGTILVFILLKVLKLI